MAGGAPGNMHPAQVAEAIRQLRGDAASIEVRPGIDPEPPPGWQPPPLPDDIVHEIESGGGEVPPDLASRVGTSPIGAASGSPDAALRSAERNAESLGEAFAVHALRGGAGGGSRTLPKPEPDPPAPRSWSNDIGLRGIAVRPTENGLALVLLTDDGELPLEQAEADQVFEVAVQAVQRGLEARLAALKSRVLRPAKSLIDEPPVSG